MNYCLLARSSMERRSVTSCYHGSNICGSQQLFLTETATCIVERWKKSGSYRVVPECNNARKSHTCHFFSFFSRHIYVTMVCWDPEILLPWQRYVTTFPLHLISYNHKTSSLRLVLEILYLFDCLRLLDEFM